MNTTAECGFRWFGNTMDPDNRAPWLSNAISSTRVSVPLELGPAGADIGARRARRKYCQLRRITLLASLLKLHGK
jgi:hypothetical protein